MNAKRKGTAREHRSRKLQEALGYTVVRAAGSHGLFDLVQVKSRDWPGRVERGALEGFQAPPNCRKLCHRWRAGQRVPDVLELP